ncbi:MAG: hypothetical protein WCP20_22880, partial [Desulfuromonadales bacterium]
MRRVFLGLIKMGLVGIYCLAILLTYIVTEVKAATLSPPSPVSPLNGNSKTKDVNCKVPISWSNVTGNTGYALNVDALGDMVMSQNQTLYSATLTNGSHNWKACTKNASGCGTYSAIQTFTVLAPATLSPPVLTSPTGGTTVTVSTLPGTVTLQWQAVSGATGYELNVDGNQVLITSGSQTTYNATLNAGSHQWYARTKNCADAYGSWTSTTTFTVQQSTLSAPSLSSPSNGSVVTVSTLPGSVSLQWSTISGGNGKYNLEVDTNPVNNVSGTSYTASLNSGSHQWRACTQNTSGVCGPWSGYSTFTVQQSTLSAPSLSSPSNGSVVTVSTLPGSVPLQWSTVSGGNGKYNLEVDTNPINNVSGTSYTASLNSGSHQWRACTQNTSGVCGSWSGYSTFTVQQSTLSAPS